MSSSLIHLQYMYSYALSAGGGWHKMSAVMLLRFDVYTSSRSRADIDDVCVVLLPSNGDTG